MFEKGAQKPKPNGQWRGHQRYSQPIFKFLRVAVFYSKKEVKDLKTGLKKSIKYAKRLDRLSSDEKMAAKTKFEDQEVVGRLAFFVDLLHLLP